ncbi:MAG: alpha/beta fold hydrolase [Methylophagaceae bacterium]
METNILILIILAFAIAPIFISMLLEASRKSPHTPSKLYWDTNIPIQYIHLGEIQIRYIKIGQGPNLVLLHTLRTQLDLFEKIIPKLSKHFTIYALDLPGHGFSSIPKTDYVPDLFVKSVQQFMDKLDINDAIVSGVSIGGTISLLMAANGNKRIKHVVAINPYDYGKGRGVERGNFVAWLIFSLSRIPVIGETVMRFRSPLIEKLILQGGVTAPRSLTRGFLTQVWQSGIRKGHYLGFLSLIRHAQEWENALQEYPNIKIPVTLIYGDNDWSTVQERKNSHAQISTSTIKTITNGGHFLVMDKPDEVIKLLEQYA